MGTFITNITVVYTTSTANSSLDSTALDPNLTSSIEELLSQQLGPRQKDLPSAILLTVVYSLIMVAGAVGNICTCIVIASTTSMQTTTNYYLFSLAVSDLMLLFFGLPPELYTIWEAYPWRLGEAFCYLRPTVIEVTSYASVLTITAFTVERYVAICHPLLSHKMSALSRAVKVIVVVWFLAVVTALPYAIHTRVYYAVNFPSTSDPVPDSLVCNIPLQYREGFMKVMFQVSTILFFITPVTIISILYILIGVTLRRSTICRSSFEERNCASVKSNVPLQSQQPRRVIIRMLVAVTVAFILCWAPFHAQRLMILYVPDWTPQLILVQSHVFYISGVMYFVSAVSNPILYNVISKRYRAAFKKVIFPCCHAKSSHDQLSRQSPKRHAMVMLTNGTSSLKLVFRNENKNQKRNCETLPLTSLPGTACKERGSSTSSPDDSKHQKSAGRPSFQRSVRDQSPAQVTHRHHAYLPLQRPDKTTTHHEHACSKRNLCNKCNKDGYAPNGIAPLATIDNDDIDKCKIIQNNGACVSFKDVSVTNEGEVHSTVPLKECGLR